MTWGEDVAAAVAAMIGRSGVSQRAAAAAAGHTHTWLGKRLRGETDFSFDDIELLGAVLDFDPVALAAEAGARALPAAPLSEVPVDELLDEIGRRVPRRDS
ncbi:MAG: hypothetical protein LBK42_11915 [Propionibacteriaceae bacterium]|jgi:hypothetical protein|nr:hypothetical protein [Propionibacteriaceae bacterium]